MTRAAAGCSTRCATIREPNHDGNDGSVLQYVAMQAAPLTRARDWHCCPVRPVEATRHWCLPSEKIMVNRGFFDARKDAACYNFKWYLVKLHIQEGPLMPTAVTGAISSRSPITAAGGRRRRHAPSPGNRSLQQTRAPTTRWPAARRSSAITTATAARTARNATLCAR
jgi:hypothetical protein